MFSTLFDVVFPACGKYIGFLSGLASTSFSNFIDCILLGNKSIVFINLFTGAEETIVGWMKFLPPVEGIILSSTLNVFSLILKGFASIIGILDSPTWVVMMVYSGTIFIAIAGIKFLKNLFV